MRFRLFFESGRSELLDGENLAAVRSLALRYSEKLVRIVVLGDDSDDDGLDDGWDEGVVDPVWYKASKCPPDPVEESGEPAKFLVIDKNGEYHVAIWAGPGEWGTTETQVILTDVTHWMYLPEPPEGNGQT